VIALGAGGLLMAASAGAGLAALAVAGLGLALHRPLARVPENAMKFAVGVLLSGFGRSGWVRARAQRGRVGSGQFRVDGGLVGDRAGDGEGMPRAARIWGSGVMGWVKAGWCREVWVCLLTRLVRGGNCCVGWVGVCGDWVGAGACGVGFVCGFGGYWWRVWCDFLGRAGDKAAGEIFT